MLTAKQRVWISKDGKRLVGDGSKEKSVLFAGRGREIPESQVEDYKVEDGLFDGLTKKAPAKKKEEPKDDDKGGKKETPADKK